MTATVTRISCTRQEVEPTPSQILSTGPTHRSDRCRRCGGMLGDDRYPPRQTLREKGTDLAVGRVQTCVALPPHDWKGRRSYATLSHASPTIRSYQTLRIIATIRKSTMGLAIHLSMVRRISDL